MATIIIHSDFGAQENTICYCFHFFSFYFPWSDGLDVMILVFFMLNFKPYFLLSFLTLIRRLFTSSSFSAIRVVSPAYLRLLIFLLEIFFFLNLWWILSYIEMKQPWVYMCFPSQSPLPPPSPPAPSRSSQCTRSERLSHASNLGWWSVSS